jgi:transposase
LAGLGCRHVVADRSYDADALLALIRAAGATPHIPSTSQRLVRRSVNRRIYRQRNLVERFFCKLKHFRRVANPLRKARQELPGHRCLGLSSALDAGL